MNMGKSTDYESILSTVDMNKLEHRRMEQFLIIIFKCFEENGPGFVASLFKPYNLRGSGLNKVQTSFNSRFFQGSYTFNMGGWDTEVCLSLLLLNPFLLIATLISNLRIKLIKHTFLLQEIVAIFTLPNRLFWALPFTIPLEIKVEPHTFFSKVWFVRSSSTYPIRNLSGSQQQGECGYFLETY